MNRCLHAPPPPRQLQLALWAALAWLPCQTLQAQEAPPRTPPIAQTAQRGVLRVTQPPEVLLDGQTARLAPGARIRGSNNLLVLSASLVGQDLRVRYLRDAQDQVQAVWILTDLEAQTPP